MKVAIEVCVVRQRTDWKHLNIFQYLFVLVLLFWLLQLLSVCYHLLLCRRRPYRYKSSIIMFLVRESRPWCWAFPATRLNWWCIVFALVWNGKSTSKVKIYVNELLWVTPAKEKKLKEEHKNPSFICHPTYQQKVVICFYLHNSNTVWATWRK